MKKKKKKRNWLGVDDDLQLIAEDDFKVIQAKNQREYYNNFQSCDLLLGRNSSGILSLWQAPYCSGIMPKDKICLGEDDIYGEVSKVYHYDVRNDPNHALLDFILEARNSKLPLPRVGCVYKRQRVSYDDSIEPEIIMSMMKEL